MTLPFCVEMTVSLECNEQCPNKRRNPGWKKHFKGVFDIMNVIYCFCICPDRDQNNGPERRRNYEQDQNQRNGDTISAPAVGTGIDSLSFRTFGSVFFPCGHVPHLSGSDRRNVEDPLQWFADRGSSTGVPECRPDVPALSGGVPDERIAAFPLERKENIPVQYLKVH